MRAVAKRLFLSPNRLVTEGARTFVRTTARQVRYRLLERNWWIHELTTSTATTQVAL